MWVLIRDQHVSARTRVYLAAEGALLSAHTCVCLAAGDALAAIKIVCIGSRSFLRILHLCVRSLFIQGWGTRVGEFS